MLVIAIAGWHMFFQWQWGCEVCTHIYAIKALGGDSERAHTRKAMGVGCVGGGPSAEVLP